MKITHNFNNMRLQLICIILMLQIGNIIYSQSILFRKHFDISNGISHNMSKDIVIDKSGYIWIGSWNGINKFDGYNFRHFKTYPNDLVKLNNNRIEGLYLNSENNFWIKTYGQQLFLFNQKTEKFEDILSSKGNIRVNTIKCLPKGVSWIYTDDKNLYRIIDKKYNSPDGIELFDKSKNQYQGALMFEIFQDFEGDEWVLTDKGIMIVGKKKVINNNIPYHLITEINQNIFVATYNGFISSYSKNGRLNPLNLSARTNNISRLFKVSDSELGILSDNCLIIYNLNNHSSKVFQLPAKIAFINSLNSYLANDNTFWSFVNNNRIARIDIKNRITTILNYPQTKNFTLTNSNLYLIHEDKFGEIWAIIQGGLFCKYNKTSNQLEIAEWTNQFGEKNIFDLTARSYIIDSQKNLWITTRNGIDYAAFEKKKFDTSPIAEEFEVRSILYDSYKRVWFGLKNGKVEIYNKDYNYIGNLSANGQIIKNKDINFGANIYCFKQDSKGNIWLGSRDKGLFVLRADKNWKLYNYQNNNEAYGINSNAIYSILEDSKKRLWIGCFDGGINLIDNSDPENIRFINSKNLLKNYPIDMCHKVRTLYQTRKGVILVGTTNGLVSFSDQFSSANEISFYYNYSNSNRINCLSNNDILHIYQDRKNKIYLSTFSGGVDITNDNDSLLSPEIKFSNINKNNGLVSDLSMSVIEDQKGFLWIASITGFSRLNPTTGKFDLFTDENLKYTFQLGEAIPKLGPNGELIFGTTKGLIRLFANQITLKSFAPQIVFTRVNIQDNSTSENKRVISENKITLAKNERNISIEFAALDYSNPNAIKYAYRLKDKDDDWTYIDKTHVANLINLKAGEHIFEVKSTNSDGIWVNNTTSLIIYVTPTFWETGFAIILYVLGFILLVFLSSYIIFKITNLRRQVKIEHELSGLKLKFFTDISHELRTPLTLISNPIDEVLLNEKLSDEGKDNMIIAKSNTDRMLKLINQILDFRKIQNNKMKVYIAQVHLKQFIDKTYQDFTGIANQKHIKFKLNSNVDETQMIYSDEDKLEKILYNLLSNAFKFTADNKQIELNINYADDKLNISVTDEGSGFEMTKIEQLFTRFETSINTDPSLSTGIGLSMVKELIQLLNGTIEVKSTKGVGSIFSIQLPTNVETFIDKNNVEIIMTDAEKESNLYEYQVNDSKTQDGNATILIVEDNPELRVFIKKVLSREYNILEASNGKEGLEITQQLAPDIIISDIMMPLMDGIEFLKAIRNNPELSHIPVILLTAKSSLEDQISGLEFGADDYITKPFSSTYLKIKIQTIIKKRKLIREYYLQQTETDNKQTLDADKFEPTKPEISSFDDRFIRKIIEIIEENIEDTEFKIDSIAESLNMSRPVFYRKIKAIIGLSPVEFVKKIRIKRAIQLLETNSFSISEIAYQCGFNTPQYLSKVFKETMGCTPSEYIQQSKSKPSDSEL